MAAQRWMFTTEQLTNTPSRKCGIDADKELSYRQQAANLIQDMGQRLSVEQLCINTAIVYMHRFYMFRSFSRFPRNEMAPACLFLAAKVEEQPRKLEHVIKVAHACLNRDHNTPPPDPKTEAYLEQAQQLVINENILLQTLGFEVTVDHPHTHVVKSTTVILAKASKDLSRTSYYLATNSLHMTTMCLQQRPTVVACVCIYMACRWANYKIPRSNEGREWYQYIDPKVTFHQIEELYNEFLNILNKSPMKLKRKIMGWKGSGSDGPSREEERSGHLSLQHEFNRPTTSTHNKHANPDQLDGLEAGRYHQHEQKLSHELRESRMEHKKEHYAEKRPGDHKSMSSFHHSDRKPQISHPQDPTKHIKREERLEGHSHSQPHRKEVPHHSHTDHRDKNIPHERHKELPHVKKESHVNGQSHTSSSSVPLSKTLEVIKSENKDSPTVKEFSATQTLGQANINPPHSQSNPGMLQKSKTAIDFSQYVKRKEQEKLEREKHLEREKQLERMEREKRREKERLERERLHKQRAAEAELLNKTFSEGSSRETKHRPPKLDISLPITENHVDQKPLVNTRERPYNVNIKSPIKPHHNITVKSPIKSSDLKQPKLELPKVQITPEKDGADPFSVNINTDPVIRKFMEGDKLESGNDDMLGESSDKHAASALNESNDLLGGVQIKTEAEELEPGEILEPDIKLNPEHSHAPEFKIKELNYDPDLGLENNSGSRVVVKQEPNSGSNTPVVSHIKQEPGSGSSTPARLKGPAQGASGSPLKLKISTKCLSSDSNHSSSKHSSPHRHKHKHKDKHKSHKHSRDKERHRDKHREKEASQAAATTTETNGQPSSLKMSFKLSDIQGHGVSSEHWSVKNKHDKHKHRVSISDPSLNKSNNSVEPVRAQPWSVTDLTKSSSSVAQSPSRKRRRTPTVDQSVEQSSHTKAAKMGSQRIRRSSSNHSVVSMELSDGEDGQTNGPQEQNTLSLLNINLMQAIAQTKQKVESLKSQSAKNSPRDPKPPINRQQSGFDLESMMWAGGVTNDVPPLPFGHPVPPPPPPDQVKPPPPPSR